MQFLTVITDKSLGLDILEPTAYAERETARAIVLDTDNNVALLYISTKGFHNLPGGGLESEESIAETLEREILEEIGCDITDVAKIGTVEEYCSRAALHQVSYGFTATVLGEKKEPSFTASEIVNGLKIIWMSLEDAIKTLESEVAIENYRGKFISARELTFLHAARKQIA